MSNKSKYAPITLFVYNRIHQTKRTIESLKNNYLAKDSHLVIYSDAPKNNASAQSVEEVRRYIKKIGGFKRVSLILRKTNLGLASSFITGISEQVKAHGRTIILEDDNVTSKYFLKFMNDGLDLYKNENRVASIHGYTYPMRGKLPETFFLKGSGSWGWATWERAWEFFEEDGGKLLSEIKRRNLSREFDVNGSYPFTKMLRDQSQGKNNSWAIRWAGSVFIRDMLTLYPGKSLVKNTGFDGSGVHCKPTDVFDTTLSNKEIRVSKIPVEENLEVKNRLAHYYRLSRYKMMFQGAKNLITGRIGF